MKVWIKMYTEILSDPKMGRMSDKLFRRTVELFLLAGKEDAEGFLPPIDDIAWTLHTSSKEIQSVIDELISLNIISIESDRYLITRFSERQNSDMSRSEINRRYYENSKQAKSESKTKVRPNSDVAKSEIQTEVRPNSDVAMSEIQTLEEEVEEEVDIEVDKELKERESKRENARAKKPKKPHGSFANVMLTDDEYRKLQEQFPDADDKIENLSVKLKAKGYSYSDHYATILAWDRKDKRDAQRKEPVQKAEQPRESWIEIADRLAGQEVAS